MKTDIVIIGAGLAGLSSGRKLRKKKPLILEKENRVGGLARSEHVDGFIFDYSGHLLHLNSKYIENMVNKLLPSIFRSIRRRSAVYLGKRIIDYPIQANIRSLPLVQQKACLMGLVESSWKSHTAREREQMSFGEWLYASFGKGLFDLFMEPYNHKVFQTDLAKMSSEWTGWSIPKPSLEEVVDQFLGIKRQDYGYNISFQYPKKGGIEVLPFTIADSLKNIRLGTEVLGVDIQRKTLTLNTGEKISYEWLIPTMPLKRFLEISEGLPSGYKIAGKGLKYVSVYNLNLGLRRKYPKRKHWFYIPEKRYLPYRIGIYSKFAPRNAPSGMESVYIEVSHLPETPLSPVEIRRKSIECLRDMEIIKHARDIIVENHINIPCAYIIHDKHRKRCLPRIFDYLRKENIIMAGRYGLWTYMGMEQTMLSGESAALEVIR